MSLLWHGFGRNGEQLHLAEEQVRQQHAVTGRTVHDGRLRIADSAISAQAAGWPDVAALFSGTNQAMLVSKYHAGTEDS